jgi:hypothetical protein
MSRQFATIRLTHYQRINRHRSKRMSAGAVFAASEAVAETSGGQSEAGG